MGAGPRGTINGARSGGVAGRAGGIMPAGQAAVVMTAPRCGGRMRSGGKAGVAAWASRNGRVKSALPPAFAPALVRIPGWLTPLAGGGLADGELADGAGALAGSGWPGRAPLRLRTVCIGRSPLGSDATDSLTPGITPPIRTVPEDKHLKANGAPPLPAAFGVTAGSSPSPALRPDLRSRIASASWLIPR